MNDQQIGTLIGRLFDRCRCRIHRGGDAGDAAPVFHLQPVDCAGPILKRVRFQGAVAVGDDVGKFYLGHAQEGTNPTAPSQAGNAIGRARS